MRRLVSVAAIGGLLTLAMLAESAEPAKRPALTSPAAAEETCGSYGTTIEFVDSPKEAARLAAKQEKLVFILHVSGNFEDPKLT